MFSGVYSHDTGDVLRAQSAKFPANGAPDVGTQAIKQKDIIQIQVIRGYNHKSHCDYKWKQHT